MGIRNRTGWVHSLISAPLCAYLLWRPSPALIADPIFGYSSREGSVIAFSAGYFLHDFIISAAWVATHGVRLLHARCVSGGGPDAPLPQVPFLVHAGSCCYIFAKVRFSRLFMT